MVMEIPGTSTIFFPVKKDFHPFGRKSFLFLLGKENGVLAKLRLSQYTWRM